MELRERYFSAAKAEWPVRRTGNLRFYLDYLFEGEPGRYEVLLAADERRAKLSELHYHGASAPFE